MTNEILIMVNIRTIRHVPFWQKMLSYDMPACFLEVLPTEYWALLKEIEPIVRCHPAANRGVHSAFFEFYDDILQDSVARRAGFGSAAGKRKLPARATPVAAAGSDTALLAVRAAILDRLIRKFDDTCYLARLDRTSSDLGGMGCAEMRCGCASITISV
jgi:hypothetical protein